MFGQICACSSRIEAGKQHGAAGPPRANGHLHIRIFLETIHQSLEPLGGKTLKGALQIIDCHRITSTSMCSIDVEAISDRQSRSERASSLRTRVYWTTCRSSVIRSP